MTDSSKRNTASRALIILLGLGLVLMLAVSLKERFESPGLTEQRQPRAMVAQDSAAQQIGQLMRQVAENPNDGTALVHLVEHLIGAQNWEAAETFAQRAVTLDTGNSKPLYLLGVIMHNQGRNKEAAEALERVLAIKDEASVRYSLGVLYIHYLDNPAKGVEHLSAGLHDSGAPEELKKAIMVELEKTPLPGQPGKSDAPGTPDTSGKAAPADQAKGKATAPAKTR